MIQKIKLIYLFSSLILAIIQSYNVEGGFKYFGYIIWFVISIGMIFDKTNSKSS